MLCSRLINLVVFFLNKTNFRIKRILFYLQNHLFLTLIKVEKKVVFFFGLHKNVVFFFLRHYQKNGLLTYLHVLLCYKVIAE